MTLRDQVQELANEYEGKMKANDLRIEQLKDQNRTYDAIRGQLQAVLDNGDRGARVEVRSASGHVVHGTTQNFEYDEDQGPVGLPKDAMPKGERFEHVVPRKGRPIADRPQA